MMRTGHQKSFSPPFYFFLPDLPMESRPPCVGIFSGRATAQQVSLCSELSLTHARHSPCPPPPHSCLTPVEYGTGNYPPTLRAMGTGRKRQTAQSPFPSDHGAAVAPVGFSVCSPRVEAPGMGGQDGGRRETATKFSSHKSQGRLQDAGSPADGHFTWS